MAPRSSAAPPTAPVLDDDGSGLIRHETLTELTAGDGVVFPFRDGRSGPATALGVGRGSVQRQDAPGGERRRRWPKRLAIVMIIVALLGGGLYAAQRIYLQIVFNRIQTIPIAEGTFDQVTSPPASHPDLSPQAVPSGAGKSTTNAKSAPSSVPTASTAIGRRAVPPAAATGAASAPVTFGPLLDTSGVPVIASDDPDAMNLLMIGLDTRSNVPKNQCATFGCDKVGTGSRTDTIMLARISPKHHSIDLISIPRDLWVRLAKSGKWSKVNAAYMAGATALISTLQANLNVPIHHLVEIDFVGFEELVKAVDGVELTFDHKTRDTVTGLAQEAGRHTVNDLQAIAYVRSRHYEQLGDDGKWYPDPTADFGRIRRQQLFIRSTMMKVLAQARSNPIKFDQLLAAIPGAVRIDNTFSFGDVQKLANQFRKFDPNSLHTATVPSKDARVGSQAVEKIDVAKAPAVLGRFGRRA